MFVPFSALIIGGKHCLKRIFSCDLCKGNTYMEVAWHKLHTRIVFSFYACRACLTNFPWLAAGRINIRPPTGLACCYRGTRDKARAHTSDRPYYTTSRTYPLTSSISPLCLPRPLTRQRSRALRYALLYRRRQLLIFPLALREFFWQIIDMNLGTRWQTVKL